MLGKCHHYLRAFEGFAGFHLVDELFWMYAHHKAELVVLVKLCLGKEVAAVHEGESVAFPEIFGGISVAEYDKWILLVAGGAAHAADGVDVVGHRLALHLALLAVPSGKA